MSTRPFRVIKASEASVMEMPAAQGAPKRPFRHIPRPIVDAKAEAEHILREANVEARRIVDEARIAAASQRAALEREAQESTAATWAAQFLALRSAQEQRAAQDLERSVSLAQLLAERLLGAALTLDPMLVAELARQALREARGARRVRMQASEPDAVLLSELRGQLGLPEDAIDVEIVPELGRGSLILISDVGRSDARIHVQLKRLGAVLHDALQSG